MEDATDPHDIISKSDKVVLERGQPMSSVSHKGQNRKTSTHSKNVIKCYLFVL